MNLYVTRNEAIECEIRDSLRASEDLTGPIDEAFDVEAIAVATITQRVSETGRVYYCARPEIDADKFWEIAERYAR
jgi:hypothetical protein